jgi:hypothetical protein
MGIPFVTTTIEQLDRFKKRGLSRTVWAEDEVYSTEVETSLKWKSPKILQLEGADEWRRAGPYRSRRNRLIDYDLARRRFD